MNFKSYLGIKILFGGNPVSGGIAINSSQKNPRCGPTVKYYIAG